MFRRKSHQTVGAQKYAVSAEAYYDFAPGDAVIADGYPGRVVAVADGPFGGTESYQVTLDNGVGGGQYSAGQLYKRDETTAARDGDQYDDGVGGDSTDDLNPIEASSRADYWYPELQDILEKRIPNERVRVFASLQRTARKEPDGTVICQNCGERHPAEYSHEGQWNQGPIYGVVCPKDNLTDYYTTEGLEPKRSTFQEQLDPDADQALGGTTQLADKQDKIDLASATVTPADEPEDQPSACGFCGCPEFGDFTDTGRGTRARCVQCGGTMVKNDGGVQWQVEFPNSFANAPSRRGDDRATTNVLDAVHSSLDAPGDEPVIAAKTADAGDWCRFRMNQQCMLPQRLNPAATAQAGYTIFTPQQRGLCNRYTATQQQACPTGMPILASPGRQVDPLWTASLSQPDPELGFHMTATWRDVEAKAKRIRADGGVRVIAASHDGVVGEVRGDNATYEATINYVPGSKRVAAWTCGCKWAAYAWGRSPAYRRFEGRQCSHVAALRFEVGARGMFGRDVPLDTERMEGQYQRSPVQVQHQRATDRAPEQTMRRRTVPPGNMRTTFSSLQTEARGGRSEIDDNYYQFGHEDGTDYAQGLDEPAHSTVGEAMRRLGDETRTHPRAAGHYIEGFKHGHDAYFGLPGPTRQRLFAASSITPSMDLARVLCSEGHTPDEVLVQLKSLGVEHKAARAALDYATAGSASGEVQVNGELASVVHVDPSTDSVTLADGRTVPAGVVLAPNWHPTIGLDPHESAKVKDEEPKGQATANPMGGSADPGTDIPRIDERDQTDAKKDKRHILHHTNDTRKHAPEFGYGMPWGANYAWCDQCNGSGCGHCGGTGQVLVGIPPTGGHGPGDMSMTTSPVGDQSVDAGDAVSSGGLSATGGLVVEADYTADSFLTGQPSQTYQAPTPHSQSPNPTSTGWATSSDPPDWEQPIIGSEFGISWDASLHQPEEVSWQPESPRTTAKKEGDPSLPEAEAPSVSGVALKAADTGRVLMIQRSMKDEKDPAAGTWEMPGGHHEEGDLTSLHAGIREWEEEVGQPFPEGGHVSHTWRSGPYQGHVVVIPSESQVDFSKGRSESNPDDPDGDGHEQAAWWQPEHAKKNPALRPELKDSSIWSGVSKAAALYDERYNERDPHAEDESEQPCDHEWCRHNEPFHTQGEHIDPPHLDYGHPDFQSAEHGVEDAIGHHPDAWLLDHQHTGPTKFSSTTTAAERPDKYLPYGHDTYWDEHREHPDEPSGLHTPGFDPYAEDHCAGCGKQRTGDEVDGTGLCHRCQSLQGTWDEHMREPLGGSTGAWWHEDGRKTFPGQGHEPVPDSWDPRLRSMNALTTLHDEPEPALPSTDGTSNAEAPDLDVAPEDATDVGPVVGIPMDRQAPWGYPEPVGSQPGEQAVDDPGSADHDMITDDATNNLPFRAESGLDLATIAANPVLAEFTQTAGFRALMGGTPASEPLSDRQAAMSGAATASKGDFSDSDIAAAAKAMLSKFAAKDFSFAEQQELINEGVTSGARARNFSDLKLAGTHYEKMVEDEDDAYPF